MMRGVKNADPTLIEECPTKLLCDLAMKTYDPNQSYSNSKVIIQICNITLLLVFLKHNN